MEEVAAIARDFYYSAIKPVAPLLGVVTVIWISILLLGESIAEALKAIGAQISDILRRNPSDRAVNAFASFLFFVLVLVALFNGIEALPPSEQAASGLLQYGAVSIYLTLFVIEALLCIKFTRSSGP